MIQLRSLTKRYGDRRAVDDLSFDVLPGQITGFLGPNGSGKSTTMRMIMGLDAPDQGTVLVNGAHFAGLHWPLREVGALLEARAIHPGRSAFNHLWALAQTNGIPRSRVHEVLDLVGLAGVERKRAGKFSLGMGQRLGIAAALLGDPGILLFDEPINGLDPEGIRWVRLLLKRLAGEGRTVLVSSHLMSEMALTADHLVVIGRGHLIADTSMERFIAEHGRPYVRASSPESVRFAQLLEGAGAAVHLAEDASLSIVGLTIAQVGDLAAAGQVTLHELSTQSSSLEEAFMALTVDSVEFRGHETPAEPLVGVAEAVAGQ